MRAAGIRRYSAPVESFDLPEPGGLGADEVLLEVRCCGVGNWDEIARNGGWDLGRQPPMALGVEAAGTVAGAGAAVKGLEAGDRVMTHSLPLRAQGAWAQWFVAAAADVAAVPESVPFEVAAALPVPALTADQVLSDALAAGPGETVLVNGAGGVTGMLIVQLARHLGARVIATAGARGTARLSAAGAWHVLDHRSPDWPGQVRELTGAAASTRPPMPPPAAPRVRWQPSGTAAASRRSPPTRLPPSAASRSGRCTWHLTGQGWRGSANWPPPGRSASR